MIVSRWHRNKMEARRGVLSRARAGEHGHGDGWPRELACVDRGAAAAVIWCSRAGRWQGTLVLSLTVPISSLFYLNSVVVCGGYHGTSPVGSYRWPCLHFGLQQASGMIFGQMTFSLWVRLRQRSSLCYAASTVVFATSRLSTVEISSSALCQRPSLLHSSSRDAPSSLADLLSALS